MTYVPATVLGVAVWGRSVGAVALDPSTGFYAFEYDQDWLTSGTELAPLHMPRRAGVYEFRCNRMHSSEPNHAALLTELFAPTGAGVPFRVSSPAAE